MRRSEFTLLLVIMATRSVDAAEPDFAHEILPVLQRACFECHGPAKQEGGLRLDSADVLTKGGDSGPVIVAGDAIRSELLRRISLPKGDSEVMPNRGEPLSKEETRKIRDWISGGAVWPAGVATGPHWAYVAPARPTPPMSGVHPMDAFVRAKLSRERVEPSPTAEPAVLARRLSLDLVGLPPTPEQVDTFVMAAKRDLPAAVEQLVDQLLASPQYGEKWARPWLDAARYADSHGFQRDDLRELWPYRDWVIRALNDDMPFDQFTIEQLAGDLLPNPTEAQLIATGFNRSAACNVEAGTDPEENRVNQVFDRINTLGAVWLGTTLECCQCHDHKYDPFTMRDYYGLFAFFNDTEIEADRSNPKVAGSIRFLGPYLDLADPETEAARARVNQQLAAGKTRLASLDNAAADALAAIQDERQEHVLLPREFDSEGDAGHRLLDDGSVLLTGDPPSTDTYTVTARTDLRKIIGFKLEALTDPSLPGTGPGRGDPQRSNFVLHEFTVTAAPANNPDAAHSIRLTDGRASFSQANWDVNGAIDGNAKSGWAINPRFHEPHWATFRVAEPMGFPDGTRLTFRLVQNFGQARTIGRLRLSALTGEYGTSQPGGDDERTRIAAEITKLEKELKQLAPPKTLVMQTVTTPRKSTMFERGDFRSPGTDVEPATPAKLHIMSAAAPRNREGLARWLVDRDNPLTARVIVNRLWLEIFGDGLVRTPEDFGLKGDPPTHPELLDWLAVEFMERGWSQKQILRTIVTSETYRQDSRIRPDLAELDPQNRLLARGSRFRLSAEGIRDNALAISGLLNLKSFGPPIRPPQPDGLWNKVGGERYEYVVSPGAERHRRGLYVVLKRMSPYPSLVTFDATARLACRVKRLRSNTPLQALTLLNDPVYVEAAQALAQRIVRETPNADIHERLQYAFRLAVARPARDTELAVLKSLYAAELAENGESGAWFAVASALLNLDETVTKG